MEGLEGGSDSLSLFSPPVLWLLVSAVRLWGSDAGRVEGAVALGVAGARFQGVAFVHPAQDRGRCGDGASWRLLGPPTHRFATTVLREEGEGEKEKE